MPNAPDTSERDHWRIRTVYPHRSLVHAPLPRHSKKPLAGTRQRLVMNESRNVGSSATVSDLALNIGRLKAVSGLAQWGINPQRIIEPTRRPSVSAIVNTGVVGGMFQRGVYASVGIPNSKPRNSTNSERSVKRPKRPHISIWLSLSDESRSRVQRVPA